MAMIRNCFIGILSAVALLTACSPSNAEEPSATIAAPVDSIKVGEEYQPCEDCPTFVRVPDAPENLRPVRFVSKYELTWAEYLLSVDDQACPIPNQDYPSSHTHISNDVADNIDKFRRSFPIMELNPVMISCYANWLSDKGKIEVAVPTVEEWMWFATAGKPGQKFPWGNDIEGAKNASVLANPEVANMKRRFGEFEWRLLSHHMPTFEVGKFEPNAWGLYDLFGNVSEVTSSFVERKNLVLAGESTPLDEDCNKSFSVMGHYAFSRRWNQKGIDVPTNRVTACAGKYSAPVGVRFIVIEPRKTDQ